jgi:transcriptional regulator with XRE-family HTH domain
MTEQADSEYNSDSPTAGETPTHKRTPNPIDQYVGARIRMRRIMLGMSQERLGDAIGLTFQQIQKYEKGTNRIGASRLQQVGIVLNVPVEFFFEGAPLHNVTISSNDGFRESLAASYVTEFMSTTEGIHLMQAFTKIKDPKIRKRILELIDVMARADSHFSE